MPILLRFLVVAVIAFLLGAAVTPLWHPALIQQSKEILSPYAVFSTALMIVEVGYAVGQWRKPPRR